MPSVSTNGIEQYFATFGDPAAPAVVLIAGLGGTGASWASQLHRFAERYFVIVPDQRGTGRTTRATAGYSTEQLAEDVLAVIDHLDVPRVHVVGSSTGGAIAQHIALIRPEAVASLTLASSFARFDPFMEREFRVRRRIAAEWDRPSVMAAYALFLFSPRFTAQHPAEVQEWIDRAAGAPAQPGDVEIGLQRVDMIAAHDTVDRLHTITAPTLVLSGTSNTCTTLPNSELLAERIPGARLITFEQADELIEIEHAAEFFDAVSDFIDHSSMDAA